MKIKLYLLTVLILTFSSVQLSFATPLVFTVTKEVTKKNDKEIDEFTELVTFDVTKYQKIRVGVLPVGFSKNDLEFSVIKIEAVENSDVTFLDKILFTSLYSSGSAVVELPSPKIKISTNKSGKYKIFIWATE